MLARVVRFEGGDAAAIRRMAEEVAQRARTGPPEGVTSTGFTLLADPEAGTMMAIGLFETEEDLRSSLPALEAMPPMPGRRAAEEILEVAVDARPGVPAPGAAA